MIDYKQRQRSLSDSTVLVSSGAFTAEKLRKTQSYTAFPRCTKLERLYRGLNFSNNRQKTLEKKALNRRWDTPQRHLGLVLRQ